MTGPTKRLCFNPCFCGTGARTRSRSRSAPNPRSSACFNPCFCGTGARTLDSQSESAGTWACFNPCFCGTGARTLRYRQHGADGFGFNPCFCGTGARTRRCTDRPRLQAEFQSLFLWNWRSNHGIPVAGLVFQVVSILVFVELALEPMKIILCRDCGTCFNPCFCGTGARTAAKP